MGPKYDYKKCVMCKEVRGGASYPKPPVPEIPRERCRSCVNKHGFPDAVVDEETELDPDVVLFREEWAKYRARQPERVPVVRRVWRFGDFWAGGKYP